MEFEADPKNSVDKFEDIQEILNYRKTLSTAVEDLDRRPISINQFKKMHTILLNSVRGQNKDRGNFRKTQNWIGPAGCTIEEATFIPPEPQQVLPYLSNLEKYIHYDEKDRLVQLGIIHAQFELIHPFLDGNGRIGRILIPLFLYEKKVLGSPMFYISAFFEAHRDEYYQRLNSVSSNGAWDDWIIFFLKAIEEQSRLNSSKAIEIQSLYEKMKTDVVAYTHSQYAIQTIDALFNLLIFSNAEFRSYSNIPKSSTIRIIKQLSEAKVIHLLKKGSGKKPSVYIFQDLFEIVG